jgi:hypothetical protein
MIFVIGFSCLSRGPVDQGLSVRPGYDHRQGKACRRRLKRRELRRKGEKVIAGACCGPPLAARAGDGMDKKIEEGAQRPVRPGVR